MNSGHIGVYKIKVKNLIKFVVIIFQQIMQFRNVLQTLIV